MVSTSAWGSGRREPGGLGGEGGGGAGCEEAPPTSEETGGGELAELGRMLCLVWHTE